MIKKIIESEIQHEYPEAEEKILKILNQKHKSLISSCKIVNIYSYQNMGNIHVNIEYKIKVSIFLTVMGMKDLVKDGLKDIVFGSSGTAIFDFIL